MMNTNKLSTIKIQKWPLFTDNGLDSHMLLNKLRKCCITRRDHVRLVDLLSTGKTQTIDSGAELFAHRIGKVIDIEYEENTWQNTEE